MAQLRIYIDSIKKDLSEKGLYQFLDSIPLEKILEIEELFKELRIPEIYRDEFYSAILSILHNPETVNSKEKEINEFVNFSLRIKDLRINELTVLVKGINKLGKYDDGKMILRGNDPYLVLIRRIFEDSLNEPAIQFWRERHIEVKRGPKNKPKTNTLKKNIPAINRILTEIGINTQIERDDLIGKFLIIAGILQPEPPKKYRTSKSYFHARIKQYLTS